MLILHCVLEGRRCQMLILHCVFEGRRSQMLVLPCVFEGRRSQMLVFHRFLKKMNDLRPSGKPGPERPNFSKMAGCKKPHKILCKIVPQTRFRASGSPGTVFEVPGRRSQRRRKAILTRLSAKTAPELAKRTKLSTKTAIGDAKPTIPYESVSQSSHGESRQRAKNIRF